MKKPIIGITMGDAAGIGAEIILKTLADLRIYNICYPVVIGSLSIMRHQAKRLGLSCDLVSVNKNLERLNTDSRQAAIIDCPEYNSADIDFAHPNEQTGKAAYHYINTAVSLALSHKIDAMVTCPISKAALNQAGYNYPGHT